MIVQLSKKGYFELTIISDVEGEEASSYSHTHYDQSKNHMDGLGLS